MDLKKYISTVSTYPGVYLMYEQSGEVIYVGKAKNLRNRLKSYFAKNIDNEKVRQMMQVVVRIEVTIAPTEVDALLLELSLIKKHSPRYNIQFKDGKGYPYIVIDTSHDFPRLFSSRSKITNKRMTLYGPYPNGRAVYSTLNYLYKIFKLRDCKDSFFNNRSRPCLRFQINRCTAPCTGLINQKDYSKNVHYTMQLLEGKNSLVVSELENNMQIASKARDYQKAAEYRDLLNFVEALLQKQIVSKDKGEYDFIAVAIDYGIACVHVLRIRNGEIVGTNLYYPKQLQGHTSIDLLTAFICKHYLEIAVDLIPKEIIINESIQDISLLEQAIFKRANRKVSIKFPLKGHKKDLLAMSISSAREALKHKVNISDFYQETMQALGKILGTTKPPELIECFDISHFKGEATIASCVVLSNEGPNKRLYRQYKLPEIDTGDDYLALAKVVYKRYIKSIQLNRDLPDIIIVDGGLGQLRSVVDSLTQLSLDNIPVISIAKGPTRKAGLEKIFFKDRIINIDNNDNIFKMLQNIRDESHKHAVSHNRKSMRKNRMRSELLSIIGVGENKRKAILEHFGGIQAVKNASVDDLTKVPGIGHKLANEIYVAIHSDE